MNRTDDGRNVTKPKNVWIIMPQFKCAETFRVTVHGSIERSTQMSATFMVLWHTNKWRISWQSINEDCASTTIVWWNISHVLSINSSKPVISTTQFATEVQLSGEIRSDTRQAWVWLLVATSQLQRFYKYRVLEQGHDMQLLHMCSRSASAEERPGAGYGVVALALIVLSFVKKKSIFSISN